MMTKITFGTVEEKRERARVYRMEQLRKLYNAWQDQVELWDTPVLQLEFTPKGNNYFYNLFLSEKEMK